MFYAIDIETTGLNPAKDKLAFFAYANLLDPAKRGIIDAIEQPGEIIKILQSAVGFVGFNLPFDMSFLEQLEPSIADKPRFDIMSFLSNFFNQPFSLKDLAFLRFTPQQTQDYLQLAEKLAEIDMLERPVSSDLMRYMHYDLALTEALASQFLPHLFVLFDPVFPEAIQRSNGLKELTEEAATALEHALRNLFQNQTIGYLALFTFLRDELRDRLEESTPLCDIKRKSYTIRKYSLKELMRSIVGQEMLQCADILLDRKHLENLAMTPERQQALAEAMVEAYQVTSSSVRFFAPSQRVQSSGSPCEWAS